MISVRTPGLYRLPVEPVRAIGTLTRADIPVMLGYTRSGPVGVGVRIESLHQFESIFGGALDHGFLWHSVKGFFETGGAAAYIIRLTSSKARAASFDQLDAPVLGASTTSFLTWRATASFPWPMIDPARLKGGRQANIAAWLQQVEAQIRDHGKRSFDPGSWSNNIEVNIRRSARARTFASLNEGSEGFSSRLSSFSGLEDASVLKLSQTNSAVTQTTFLQAAEIDPTRQIITWSQSLSTFGFNVNNPIRIESVEFDIEIYRDGKLEQSFTALAPDKAHSRSILRVIQQDCRSISFTPIIRRQITPGIYADEVPAILDSALTNLDVTDPANWPKEGSFSLSGGTDGLEAVTAATYLEALEEIRSLKEPAMIAAPDLVLPAATMKTSGDVNPINPTDCQDMSPSPVGHLNGQVFMIDDDGLEVPLAGVDVRIAGQAVKTRTDNLGGFAASNIILGLVSVRLSKPGFEPLENIAQSSTFISSSPEKFILSKTLTPATISDDDILLIQRAFSNPTLVGSYKIAILDTPQSKVKRVDEIMAWRSQLGTSDRMAYFAPWLKLPPIEMVDKNAAIQLCPPSGHICGAFAGSELASGIHHSGANVQLRYCAGVSLDINDVQQEGLNPIGINAIRVFPGRGTRAHGTRTLSADPEWRFITTRRIMDVIEETLSRTLKWAVFEPNTVMTRHAIATSIASFLNQLWRMGILRGTSAGAAYSVKCDLENNPDEDRHNGKFVADIGVAPSEPYEFIFFRVGSIQDAIQVTEIGA